MVNYKTVCPYCGSEDYIETDDFRWKCETCGKIFDDPDTIESDDEYSEDFESNEGMLDNLDDEQNLFNEFAYDDDIDDDYNDDYDDDFDTSFDNDYESDFDNEDYGYYD